eukprot:TRINITY_DN90645_c0_g1_i1.p1 TRINITY_DN90645_c0_g1~~TRINITY_DN90645_c0_g1_i1.p1  ORF type:complete len:702 (-),score=50.07 TRINITY_DN90645_c0_g1_i1:497-2602(-)
MFGSRVNILVCLAVSMTTVLGNISGEPWTDDCGQIMMVGAGSELNAGIKFHGEYRRYGQFLERPVWRHISEDAWLAFSECSVMAGDAHSPVWMLTASVPGEDYPRKDCEGYAYAAQIPNPNCPDKVGKGKWRSFHWEGGITVWDTSRCGSPPDPVVLVGNWLDVLQPPHNGWYSESFPLVGKMMVLIRQHINVILHEFNRNQNAIRKQTIKISKRERNDLTNHGIMLLWTPLHHGQNHTFDAHMAGWRAEHCALLSSLCIVLRPHLPTIRRLIPFAPAEHLGLYLLEAGARLPPHNDPERMSLQVCLSGCSGAWVEVLGEKRYFGAPGSMLAYDNACTHQVGAAIDEDRWIINLVTVHPDFDSRYEQLDPKPLLSIHADSDLLVPVHSSLGSSAAYRLPSAKGNGQGNDQDVKNLEQSTSYTSRYSQMQQLHRIIDDYLDRSLCRLDNGSLCQHGRTMSRSSFNGSDGRWGVSGHTGDLQQITKLLFDTAFSVKPRRICEVGFNVGHSAVTLLTASGTGSSYLGFDLPIINPGVNELFFSMLQSWLPEHQLAMNWGDEAESIPAYVASLKGHEAKCELVFYDGSHTLNRMLHVLPLLHQLSIPGAAIIVDDVRCPQPQCRDSTYAYEFLIWAGFIEELRCKTEHVGWLGWRTGQCIGRFHWPEAVRCPKIDRKCVSRVFKQNRSTHGSFVNRPEAWPRCCI